MTSAEIERRLAEHVSAASFERLTDSTVHAVQRQLVWTVGSCLLGLGRDMESQVALALQRLGGPGPAPLIGSPLTVSAPTAGLVHGYLTKLPEYEDKYWKGGSHGYAVAAAVVPAALAAASGAEDVHGSQVVTAVAVAVDMQARLLAATPTYNTDSGWNVTYLYSALGSAAAAAHVMGLDRETTLHALGIAYAQLAGTMQSNVERAGVIPVQMGFGVRNGLCAAQLAAAGMTGPREFLTGAHGLFNLQLANEKVDWDALMDGIEATRLAERIGFKAYPCGAVAHPALDAVREVTGDGVSGDSIVSITIRGTSRLQVMMHDRDPTRMDAVTRSLFDLPRAVACVAIDGDLRLDHFEEPALSAAKYAQLRQRVSVVTADTTEDVTEAIIEFVDGHTSVSPPIRIPRGHPDNPLGLEEIIDRYWDCWEHGSGAIRRDNAERALDMMLNIQETNSPAQILSCLAIDEP